MILMLKEPYFFLRNTERARLFIASFTGNNSQQSFDYMMRAIKLGFLAIFLLALPTLATAQTDLQDQVSSQSEVEVEDEAAMEFLSLRDFGRCYDLDWGYDRAYYGLYDGRWNRPGRRFDRDRLVWYCQARPLHEPAFVFPQFTAYKENRGFARDHALLRCERHAPRCTTRCALAPRFCSPHFWQ